MSGYNTVLSVVDLSRRGELVARRAYRLARACGARLVLAHVVRYEPGYESDHIPFLTPQEMEAQMLELARQQLAALVERLGPSEALEQTVVAGRKALAELTARWRPDLIVVGSHAPHGLNAGQGAAHLPGGRYCDVLMVQMDQEAPARRLLRGLIAPLLAWS